jgi:uncharacterized protein
MSALALGAAFAASIPVTSADAADPVDPGRFVWHDLLTKDVGAAKRFYGALFGWRFEDTKRGDRAYILARSGSTLVAGMVDVSADATTGPQWLSYMSVADVDRSVAQARTDGGQVLVEARNFPRARAAVIADPQGAPLGLAQVRQNIPDPADPLPGHFFWNEYLARDAGKALDFYRRLGGYESAISDSRLGIEYHLLRTTRARAGLFQLPASATGVEPNWLPYVLVNDPAALAARVGSLGGRILLPAAPERRNSTLVVVADPGGAPLALQKFPF